MMKKLLLTGIKKIMMFFSVLTITAAVFFSCSKDSVESSGGRVTSGAVNKKSGIQGVTCFGSNALSIFVSGGTVYTAGEYTTTGHTPWVPCYWTGTTKTDLYNDNGNNIDARATSICVTNGIPCTAGYVGATACYWVGTNKIDLLGSSLGAEAQSIYGTSDGYLYASGFIITAITANTVQIAACYWAKGTRIDLP
jgi:hypothetical protein